MEVSTSFSEGCMNTIHNFLQSRKGVIIKSVWCRLVKHRFKIYIKVVCFIEFIMSGFFGFWGNFYGYLRTFVGGNLYNYLIPTSKNRNFLVFCFATSERCWFIQCPINIETNCCAIFNVCYIYVYLVEPENRTRRKSIQY